MSVWDYECETRPLSVRRSLNDNILTQEGGSNRRIRKLRNEAKVYKLMLPEYNNTHVKGIGTSMTWF
jgi:hypothetical protein